MSKNRTLFEGFIINEDELSDVGKLLLLYFGLSLAYKMDLLRTEGRKEKKMSKELKALDKLWNGNEITGKDYLLVKNAIKRLEQLEKELEELKDAITIYLDLESKIEKVGLIGLCDIEYSNYLKSYRKLKKLLGDSDV